MVETPCSESRGMNLILAKELKISCTPPTLKIKLKKKKKHVLFLRDVTGDEGDRDAKVLIPNSPFAKSELIVGF